MVQGQFFLKRRGGEGGGITLFLFNFFNVYHIYIYKVFYPLQNCIMYLKKNYFFSVTIILSKKVILNCLKMNLKIPHKGDLKY